MADAKLTALTAASALAAADLFYVSQSAASRKATGTQLLTLVGTTYVPLAGGTMTGALTIASGTLTASAPALSITQTWNAGAVGFIGALIDVTNTASAGASYPLVIKVNGSSVFEFTKAGRFNATQVSTGLVQCSYIDVGSFSDTLIHRDAAATLAQRNGTNAQTLRVYGTYTDASNYERLTLSTTAGSSVNITAETLGTGGDNLDLVLNAAGSGYVTIPSTSLIVNTILIGLKGVTYPVALYRAGNIGINIASSGRVAWTSTSEGTDAADLAFHRDSAGVAAVDNGTAGTYRDLKLRNLIQTEYSQLTEMTAPSAPATNSVRIYAEDNGSGKTRLMALFATGSAVQLGIEP